jgi:hypothetical protein
MKLCINLALSVKFSLTCKTSNQPHHNKHIWWMNAPQEHLYPCTTCYLGKLSALQAIASELHRFVSVTDVATYCKNNAMYLTVISTKWLQTFQLQQITRNKCQHTSITLNRNYTASTVDTLQKLRWPKTMYEVVSQCQQKIKRYSSG